MIHREAVAGCIAIYQVTGTAVQQCVIQPLPSLLQLNDLEFLESWIVAKCLLPDKNKIAILWRKAAKASIGVRNSNTSALRFTRK